MNTHTLKQNKTKDAIQKQNNRSKTKENRDPKTKQIAKQNRNTKQNQEIQQLKHKQKQETKKLKQKQKQRRITKQKIKNGMRTNGAPEKSKKSPNTKKRAKVDGILDPPLLLLLAGGL